MIILYGACGCLGASGAASVVASTAEGKVSETVSAVDDSIKHVEEDDNEDQGV